MLEELKLRVTHHLLAVCCVAFCCYLYFFELCVLTIKPLDNVCFLDLTEAFSVTIQVVFFFTTLFIAPGLCFHGWGFVSPGLTNKTIYLEKQYTHRTQMFVLFGSPLLWLLVSLIFSHVLTHFLCMWFLGYSLSADGLILQYLPLMSGFLWFKLKCFVCVSGCFAGLQAAGRRLLFRRWLYSSAVLLGAFLAAGAPQFILSLCLLLLCEVWFFSSYVIKSFLHIIPT